MTARTDMIHGASLLAAVLAIAACSAREHKPKPVEVVVFDAAPAPAFSVEAPAGWSSVQPAAGEQARWVGPADEGAPSLAVRRMAAPVDTTVAHAELRTTADGELKSSWRARSVVKEGRVTTGGGEAQLLVVHADVPEDATASPSVASYYYYLLVPDGERSWVLVGRTDAVTGAGDAGVEPRHQRELLRAFSSFRPPQ